MLIALSRWLVLPVIAREGAASAAEQRTKRLLLEAEKQVKQWQQKSVAADAAAAVAVEARPQPLSLSF